MRLFCPVCDFFRQIHFHLPVKRLAFRDPNAKYTNTLSQLNIVTFGMKQISVVFVALRWSEVINDLAIVYLFLLHRNTPVYLITGFDCNTICLYII